MLVDGKWSEAWKPVQATDAKGGFVRQISSFRSWVTPDGAPGPTGEGGFRAEPDRYHLYAAFGCPWATRVLIARKLKRLEDVVSVAIVEPVLTDQGWQFGAAPDADRDTVNGATYLHEIYTRADPHFTGRATVPALWDKRRQTIVNNESADLVRMFNSGFGKLADASIDLYPEDLRSSIDALNAEVYGSLNNGVYRAGFATTQLAYEEAFAGVFATLDALERRLDGRPLPVWRQADGSRHSRVCDAGALRRGLSRTVQMQPAPHRRLRQFERLSRPPDRAPGFPRDVQSRSHQARLLFDQGPEPYPDRPARSRAQVGATSGVSRPCTS